MTYAEVIRCAIPDADDSVCDHVLWGRTPFPMRSVWAKELYRAAFRWRRATSKGIMLCGFCDRIAEAGKYECTKCREVLEGARDVKTVNQENPLDILDGMAFD